MKPNILLMGLPGSGKGTYCENMLSQGYHVIALGKRLRREVKNATPLSKTIQHYVNKGILIPDELAFRLVREELETAINQQITFIIEGFPSTVSQFELFIALLKEKALLQAVQLVYLDCPESIALERIMNRLTCSGCERIFNAVYRPPLQQSTCDCCGSFLFVREEDNYHIALRRIEQYKSKTVPIIALAKNIFLS